MGVRLQSLEKLLIWLAQGHHGNVRCDITVSLFATTSMWRPHEKYSDSSGVDLAESRVPGMGLVAGRGNQGFLNDKAAKTVTYEYNGSGLAGLRQRNLYISHTLDVTKA